MPFGRCLQVLIEWVPYQICVEDSSHRGPLIWERCANLNGSKLEPTWTSRQDSGYRSQSSIGHREFKVPAKSQWAWRVGALRILNSNWLNKWQPGILCRILVFELPAIVAHLAGLISVHSSFASISQPLISCLSNNFNYLNWSSAGASPGHAAQWLAHNGTRRQTDILTDSTYSVAAWGSLRRMRHMRRMHQLETNTRLLMMLWC